MPAGVTANGTKRTTAVSPRRGKRARGPPDPRWAPSYARAGTAIDATRRPARGYAPAHFDASARPQSGPGMGTPSGALRAGDDELVALSVDAEKTARHRDGCVRRRPMRFDHYDASVVERVKEIGARNGRERGRTGRERSRLCVRERDRLVRAGLE